MEFLCDFFQKGKNMSWLSAIIECVQHALKWISGNNDIAKEKLKWRQSSENIEYHRNKENEEFNCCLENKDTKVCDAIRKKKQKEIEELKRSI